ncbi:MAG: tetratricopeptide repeat protein [Verrucomicrobiales bacterium]|nr:tetratricopeptide repeat protein [Verrucomicrobiales bacterium]
MKFSLKSVALLSLAVIISSLLACQPSEQDDSSTAEADSSTTGDGDAYSPYHNIPDAKYVGAKDCKTCHQKEFDEWKQSDHHRAMEPANAKTVLGDFNDVDFVHFEHRWRFYKKGEEFWVNAEDENGKRQDYKIDYTFGFFPLQQYLIPFPGGRYQALQVCWDSRPKEDGGQRWYHLYPDEEVPPADVLHWTRRHFNWNFMCADCHSTNLRKNFDVASDSYDTQWSEMNVSCEACHGPASEHLKWAAHPQNSSGTASEDHNSLSDDAVKNYLKSKGLVVTLKEPEPGVWSINPESGQPQRTPPLKSNVQVESCARCHAHRRPLQSKFVAGQSFLDTHNPSVLRDLLYHPDGQINEEVYVYGSFIQSKMHHAGVRCSDCHNPHTMKLQAQGNALCVRCHLADKYNSPKHHFHQLDSTGARCVECHMPTKTYMGVDARRDHSLRIPRPDLSKKLGSPNACSQCHQDKDLDWAIETFEERWGKSGLRNAHYGELLAAGRQGGTTGMEKLIALATDKSFPDIVRATALAEFARQPSTQQSLNTISQQLQDPNPLVREQAIFALESTAPAQRLSLIRNMLNDPIRAVRVETARLLSSSKSQLEADEQSAWDRAAEEFIAAQMAMSDRAAGHLRLALFYSDLGQSKKAEAAYRDAIRIEPEAIPPRINLAEMLYQQGRIEESGKTFAAAITADPSNGVAHEALARYYIRSKQYEQGLAELKLAAQLMPEHASTQYFLGVALNSMGQFDEALPALQKAHQLDARNTEYLIGLTTICRDAGKTELALSYVAKLIALDPQSQSYRQLEAQLKAGSR